MLGITDWSQFWISFWSALFAGAIDSLLVGFIVGVMILAFQSQIDKRRLRHKCEREIATFREQLRYTLDQAEQIYVDDIAIPFSLVKSLVALLRDLPIDLWYENIPKLRAFLTTVKEFQQVHTSFSLVANNLNAKTKSIIRQVNDSKGLMAFNDAGLQTFFIGRINGLDSNVVLPWISGGGLNETALPSFEERYALLIENKEVSQLVNHYLEARKHLAQSVDVLRAVILEPTLAKQTYRFLPLATNQIKRLRGVIKRDKKRVEPITSKKSY